MTTTTQAALPQAPALTRNLDLAGRLPLSFSLAGGFILGGFFVALASLAGRISGSGLLHLSAGLFLVGASMGLAAGMLLAFLGRPAGSTAAETRGAVLLGLLYAVPALIIGFVVAGWIAMTIVSLYAGSVVAMALTATAWMAGTGILWVAAASAAEALHNAWERVHEFVTAGTRRPSTPRMSGPETNTPSL
jgi:hypothetical protein